MKKTSSVRKKLQEIFETGAFERLKFYKREEKWEKLSLDDRELLGTLFVMQGERELINGNKKKVDDTFSLACKVAPSSPRVYYRQAVAFLSNDHQPYHLKMASNALCQATTLDQGFFDAWYAWGVVSLKLGVFFQDLNYLEEACERFLQAETLLVASTKLQTGEFYHHFGNALYELGKLSGEAHDFSIACDHYRKALESGYSNAHLWCDFGKAMTDLACLVNKSEVLFEGLDYYWKAVQLNPECFEAWSDLAFNFEKLFRTTYREAFFQLANDCFENGCRFHDVNSTYLLKWGQLLTHYGKSRRDLGALDEACVKFESASEMEPNNPFILSSWAEAKILLGTADEKIEDLKMAESLIIQSVQMQPENANVWGLYGFCLCELGRYFDDSNYLNRAIEKYQFALNLKKENHLLWHGLTQCYFLLGDQKDDYKLIERATRLCVRVIETGGKPFGEYWHSWGVGLMKLYHMTDSKKYLEAAVDKFEQAVRIGAKDSDGAGIDPEWLFNLGNSLDTLGELIDKHELIENAVQVLNKLIERAPEFPNGQLSFALALFHHGEMMRDLEVIEKSLQHYRSAFEQDPDADYVYFEWAMALISYGRIKSDPSNTAEIEKIYDEAEALLKQAIHLGNQQAFYQLGALYAIRGQLAFAMDCLEKADKQDSLPTNDELLNDHWLESLWNEEDFKAFLQKRTKE